MNNLEDAERLFDMLGIDSLDAILNKLGLSHQQWRAHKPNSPITMGLAFEVIHVKEMEDLTNRQIQKIFNLTVSQLNYILYNSTAFRAGPKLQKGRRIADAILANEEAENPLSQTELAKKLETSQANISRISRNIGLPSQRKGKLTEEDMNEIKEQVANGTRVADLAKQYNVTADAIYRRLRKC